MRIITLLAFLFLLPACTESTTTDVSEYEKLELAHAQSIKLPVDSIEALVYQYTPICGNTTSDELQQMFFPNLLGEPYKSIVESKYPGLTIYRKSDTTYNRASMHTLYIDFDGGRISDDSVFVRENYECNNEKVTIVKYFIYRDGDWNVQVVP